MLKILLGTDWVSLQEVILGEIAQEVKNQRPGIVYMVPELCSHDTERALAEKAGDTASRYAEVLTFSRLARRVSEGQELAVPACLDNGGRVVAMAAAARALVSKLKVYAAVETKSEFLTGLLDAVDEFKRCCISPEDLLAAAGKTQGTLAQKLEELSLLLEAYDSLCAKSKLDPRDQMTWLLDALEEGDYGQKHVFYIDGFPDFTRQHMAILEHLIAVSPKVTVGFLTDAVASHALAFEKAGETVASLLAKTKQLGLPYEIVTVKAREHPLQQVCMSLFQGKLPQLQVPCVKVAKADSIDNEVRFVAESILSLVQQGVRYREINVVCSDLSEYRNVLQMQMERCHIPMYIAGTESVLEKSVITTVLSALDAALEGFEQRDVLAYLKSVLSPVGMEDGDSLENYCVLWAIRGNRWLKDWDKHPNGLGETWSDGAKNALERLNATRKAAISPLQHLKEGITQAATVSQQVCALYTFLEEIKMPQRLRKLSEDFDKAGDNRTAQIFNQLWEILLSALEQMHDVLGSTYYGPEQFKRLLTLLLSQYDVGTIPPVLDSVHVGNPSAMRLRRCKHLFVLGGKEGQLPGYSGSTGILSDQERTELRSCGLPLTGGSLDGLQAEFSDIYGVFNSAGEGVCLSYGSGQPSYITKRLEAMAGNCIDAQPILGFAMADKGEAGALLARFGCQQEANSLGLGEEYRRSVARANYSIGNISRDNVRALYGESLTLSASQVDRQAECRMCYFLKYGLRAKERKEAGVDPAEFGTYVHWVLENTAQQVMAEGGFHSVSLERTMEVALAYSDSYAKEHFADIDSGRIHYLFHRNRRELEMVVEELWQELKSSEFIPKYFELGFGAGEEMPFIAIQSKSLPAVLRGFVDRVDIYQSQGQNYFRVVDYKTGKKDFDYCDVFNGVGLQMLLYLFALEQAGQELLGDEPRGAGVQYFPARVPIVSTDGAVSQEELSQLRKKQWVRPGLLLHDEGVLIAMEPESMDRLCCQRKKDGVLAGDLADRAQFQLLRQYIFQIVGEMVDSIAAGKVEANPYTRGTAHNPCTYCPYTQVCHAESVAQRRNYKTMTSQEFWEEVGKECNHG